jgi:DNA adenine methylase
MMADQDSSRSSSNDPQSKDRLRTLSPFRYPGGKSWLRKKVLKWVATLGYRPSTFIEPFAGGGSVGLVVAELGLADKVILIERDPDVASVWRTMLGDRWGELTAHILSFRMSRKRVLEVLSSDDEDDVARAFRCVLRNRVQRGGILSPTAGLLREGERGRGLKSRWYPETLAERINAIHGIRDRIRFVESDALKVLPTFKRSFDNAFFVDPPYTANGKGPGIRLYRHAEIDHEKLFTLLAQLRGACFVTYHPAAPVKRIGEQFGFKSSTTGMRTTHHRHRRELVFLKPALARG